MALVKKIEISQDIIDKVRFHLIAHYEHIQQIEFKHSACHDIADLIAQLVTGSISYPVASRIRMYLEFRSRHLQLTCDHSCTVRSQLLQLFTLIDQFGEFK